MFPGLPSPLARRARRIKSPDDALVEALVLAAEADALDELADAADPERTVPAITDVRALAEAPEDDPGKLRGGATLLRGTARRMVDALPAWREARERLVER